MNYVIEAFADTKGTFIFTAYFKDDPDLLLAFEGVKLVEDEDGLKIEYNVIGSNLKSEEAPDLEYVQRRGEQLLREMIETMVNKDSFDSLLGYTNEE